MPNVKVPKSKVVVLFGGCSEEHDVSVKSAAEIGAHLDRSRYEPIFVGITRSGEWARCAAPVAGWENESASAIISPDRQVHGLLVRDGAGWTAEHVDVVFPVLHGRYGEDGAIQGLLDLSGIPYVGCDIPSSVLSIDKSLAYVVARNAGVPTPEFWVVGGRDEPHRADLPYPVFVKPARSGSSFGVTKVERAAEMDAAIASAREFDSKVLIERAVIGSEVGCAVLGSGADLVVGEVDQITLHHGFFRIHQEVAPEAGSENAVVTVPAPIPRPTRDLVRQRARDIYVALGCVGLARVDMFLREDGEIVLNEVNTLPGFTSYSRYPRMMAGAGIGMSEVIDRCIDLALAR